jgi:AbrB family looped-hinge helix DNA binding protein
MVEPDTLVEVNAQGRMTLPAKVRKALGVRGRSQLAVEVVDGEVRLRPTVVIAREDAWAYTREHMDRIRRALADVEAGRERAVTRKDVEALERS